MDQSPPTYSFRPPIATTRRRQPPSEPTILIFFLVILSLLLLFFFFFLLPLLSHAPKIIKPTPVKVKSNWNSLIVFLFLLAIIAGVLAQNNDVPSTPSITNRVNNRASEINRNRDQVQVNGDLRRRSSSSHPDLRQKPLPENGDNNHSRRREGRKENNHRSEPVSGDIRHRSRQSEARKVIPNVPEIMVQRQSPIRVRPPPPPVRAPAPAPPVSGKSRRRRTSRSVGLDQTVQVTSQNIRLHDSSHIPPPPRPPPNPPANREAREDKKEITPAMASLNDHRKRNRRNRQEPRDIQPSIQKTPPPPPPPPPPPSSMFHKMFKKEKKPKKIPTVTASAPPPHPPPPPPKSFLNTLFKSGGKNKQFPSSTTNDYSNTVTKNRGFNSSSAASSSQSAVQPPSPPSEPKSEQSTASMKQESKPTIPIQPPPPPSQRSEPLRRRPASTHKPPLPTKASNYYHDRDDFLSSSSHSQSPSIPLPPPPPPFKLPARKFELHGHYVRLRSVRSSDFSSPDRDDLRSTIIDGGDSFGPSPISSTSSSPDVNTKADRFISKNKDEWRTERRKERKISPK